KLACEPDGVNINHECGTTYPQKLIAAVLANQADLGIAFDGDGDRVLFVDKHGTLYNGDKLIYVIAQSYVARGMQLNGVVGTVMTNLAMEHALNSQGFELVRTKVGDRYVLEELHRRNWSIGGEASGHILCLDKHSTGDGIISALQVLAAIIKLGVPLAEIIKWQDYPQALINVKFPKKDSLWHERSACIIDEAKNTLGQDGRVIVRASGTEPLVRVMVEAKSLVTANHWAKKIADKIG
ncbi:MAG: phosphoglucosamine mutase, partial [Burkholderiales bacterium]